MIFLYIRQNEHCLVYANTVVKKDFLLGML
jgi:hypothetical protein